MNRSIINIGLVLLLGPSLSAYAGMTPTQKMKVLKQNIENTELNRKAYSENKEIAQKNISEVQTSLDHLKKAEQKLKTNSQNIDSNKAQLRKMQSNIEMLKKGEQKNMNLAQKKIEDLKLMILAIEEDQKQRQMNITAYDKKMNEIDQEIAAWIEQGDSLQTLQKEIQTKTRQAQNELKKWQSKKAKYEREERKWSQQQKKAAQVLADMTDLKNN